MTAIELITKEDLRAFKSELLTEIKAMIQPGRVRGIIATVLSIIGIISCIGIFAFIIALNPRG